jgi:hypothetical protein
MHKPRQSGVSANPFESDTDTAQARLAVLIDADNAHAGVVDGLLAEVARYGVASVKRIYGDWTQPQLGSWKKVLLEHSIVPVQQFAYTKGKNATDSALIIDAMDLMYTRRFDGFCLVSSDSDFTRLASRLREEGLMVYGFGERKTPAPFVSACDRFVYTDVLRSAGKSSGKRSDAPTDDKPQAKGESAGPADQATDQAADQQANQPADLLADPIGKLIADAIEDVSDETGWAGLGSVGSTLTKLRPDFDSRLYGYRKFSDLVRSMAARFELEERNTGTGAGKQLFVRLAPKPAGKAGAQRRRAPKKSSGSAAKK